MSPLLLAGIALLLLLIIWGYNALTRRRNQVDNAFSSIDVMLKKRFDLIPNLVATVQGYSQYEQSTLTNLVALRSKAINGELSHNESVDLDNTLMRATGSLVLLSESYPELKASGHYIQLQRALNESEEQISAARRNYNATVRDYNNAVQQFPSNILAGIFAFHPRTFLAIPEVERANSNIDQLFS